MPRPRRLGPQTHARNPPRGYWRGPKGWVPKRGTRAWMRYYLCNCKLPVISKAVKRSHRGPIRVGKKGKWGCNIGWKGRQYCVCQNWRAGQRGSGCGDFCWAVDAPMPEKLPPFEKPVPMSEIIAEMTGKGRVQPNQSGTENAGDASAGKKKSTTKVKKNHVKKKSDDAKTAMSPRERKRRNSTDSEQQKHTPGSSSSSSSGTKKGDHPIFASPYFLGSSTSPSGSGSGSSSSNNIEAPPANITNDLGDMNRQGPSFLRSDDNVPFVPERNMVIEIESQESVAAPEDPIEPVDEVITVDDPDDSL
jgi:hypothetical protein